MQSVLDLEFVDWATSLLPDTLVMAFYVKGFPIFWNIDVEVVVPAAMRNITRKTVYNDPIGHLIKLWSHTLKHKIRNDHRSVKEIESVWIRTVGTANVPADGYFALRGALDVIAKSDRHESLVAQCYAELDKAESAGESLIKNNS